MPLVKVFAVVLIALGAPLEAYYYWFSFTKEGVPTAVAVLAAAGLIMLLNSAVYLSGKKKRWYVLAGVVAVFSIISTSAGQDFAVLSLSVTEVQGNLQHEQAVRRVDDLKNEIATIDQEIASYTEERTATVQTLEDQAKWRTADATVEARKALLRSRRDTKSLALIEAENSLVVAAGEATYGLYDHYATLLGGKVKAATIQFWKHLWLSFLIMLMAPTGIKMWGLNPRKAKEATDDGRTTRNPRRGWSNLFALRPCAPSAPVEQGRGRVINDLPEAIFPVKKTREGKIVAAGLRRKGRLKVAEIDLDAWDRLPDPASLRRIAPVCGLTHPVLYNAVNEGELQGWGKHPVMAYKKDVDEWLKKRLPSSSE